MRITETKLRQSTPLLPPLEPGDPPAVGASTLVEPAFAAKHFTPPFRQHLVALELKNRLKIRLILCWVLSGTVTFSTACFFGLVVFNAFTSKISSSLLASVGTATVTQV